jgi:uncharacterized protein involved in outer membrane biogenesis
VVVASIAWYVSSLDLDRFRGPIERELTALVGREVEIGRIEKSSGVLRPRIEVDELVVFADPVSRSELARIERVRIGLDLLLLLRRTVRIERIDVHGVRLRLASDAEGNPTWPVHFGSEAESETSGEGSRVHVELSDLAVAAANLTYFDGKLGKTTRALIDRLELSIHRSGRLDLSVQGDVEGLPVQAAGRVVPPSGDAGSEAAQQVVLEGRVGEGTFRGSGTVVELLQASGLDLELEARLPRLPLPDDWGEALVLEPVQASARVKDSEGAVRLEGVTVDVGGGTQRVRLTGEVEDLFGERRATLDATLDLASLDVLSALVEYELPAVGPVHGTLRLRELEERLHIEDIDLIAGADDAVRASVQGKVSDLTGLVALDLRASVDARDPRRLLPPLDRELPEVGPLHLEARFVGAGSAVHVQEINARLGREGDLRASARGSVDLIGRAANVDLELRAAAPGTRRLEPWVGRELPELGPVEGEARLRGTPKRLRLDRAELRAGPQGAMRLVVKSGSLPLPPGDAFELGLELSAPQLSAIGALLDTDLPPRGPVRATGTLRVTPEHVALHAFRARIDRTTLEGAASAVDTEGRRRFTAELRSPELYLEDVLANAGTGEGEGSFLERRLPVESLRAQDAELVVRVDRLFGRGGALDDVKLRAVLERGKLSVDPLSFRWEKGQLSASAGADASGSAASWWLRAKANGIDVQSMTAQFTDETPVAGAARLNADLTSHGGSGQEVIEGLSGDFSLALRGGVLRGDYGLMLRRDIVSALALSRVRAGEEKTRCFVGHFEIDAGVVDTETLLVDGEHVILHGRGHVDLGAERFDLVLTPKAKRPGIGLMEPVAVKGTFQKPVVRPVKLALAKDAAKAALGALLVPGVGLIAPFLHTGTFGADPCSKALVKFLEPE